MHICPVCNGLRSFYFYCSRCGRQLEEKGKVTDYFGAYSPYMEIDMMKRSDGYSGTLSRHECAHLYYCPNCNIEEEKLIKE